MFGFKSNDKRIADRIHDSLQRTGNQCTTDTAFIIQESIDSVKRAARKDDRLEVKGNCIKLRRSN